MTMEKQSKIYVAGHTGLVGSALGRRLEADGYGSVLTRTHAQLDLTDQGQVEAFFRSQAPEYVFLAAARVGGIHANATYPAEFIYTNLAIQTNVLHAAYRHRAKRVIFFGSSCAYPKQAPQPMREEYLHGGPLEPTSEPYGMAKLAGMSMCAAYNRQHGARFLPVIPATVYGPHDSFDPAGSHVLPALLRRFVEARRALARGETPEVVIWGTGQARREFLFVDDLAQACLMLMGLDEARFDTLLEPPLPVTNIGAGEDICIRDLATMIAGIVGYDGPITFDASKPDGAPRKQLDTSRLARLGWRPSTSLTDGLRRTYEWYAQFAR
jgi:GDP-L-fucose synthase